MLSKLASCIENVEFPTTHISILYRWLLAQGYSKNALLSNSLISERTFNDVESYACFAHQQQFILHALALTKNEFLGLEIGRYIGRESSGLIGYAVKCAPTLNKALDTLSQNFKFRNSLFITSKVITKQACLLTFDEAIEFSQAKKFLYCMFISACISLFVEASNHSAIIKSVSLTIKKPDNWHKSFYPDIIFYFNAERNYIAFDAQYLDEETHLSDPLTLKNLQEYFSSQALNLSDEGFINQVCRVITRHLAHCPTQDEIAANLGLSTRSLRRKLQEFDITYQEVLNTVRAEKAVRLLKDHKLRIYQVSELMGYSNLSNFRRAFKIWTGKSFKDFR